MNTMNNEHVDSWGADLDPKDRPGVPEEIRPPEPIGNPPYSVPERQTEGRPTAHSATRPITPVYGTAIPQRGVSGLLRAIANRIPEYKPRRWMMLMLADRIDVIEHNPLALAIGVGAIALVGVGALTRRRR